ncbi:glycosyltransferase family 17 protein [Rhodotorula diobovata]|uniref:Glycosyltransferase family 17 protein n=1 Tax=Rhodotorula diobovata TaxID=5288 RepID=A0A5C5G546_9BASI|nr:glycosyltransferase family 17 protein [Rhodotorula diobovata]
MHGLRRVRPLHLALGLVALVVLVSTLVVHPNLPRGYLAYSTRPLWDTSEAPTDVIPHFWADDVPPTDLCKVHGWPPRSHPPQVWDATIFSTELDLLLVRLHELSPVVSRFFILESDRTFTGLSKPRILSSALDTDPRFKPFLAKVTYQPFTGAPLARGESPFEQEIALRRAMTDLLRTEYPTDPATPPPVMVFSDVDEVPSRKTAELLAACDFASPVHLGMKSYLYSFEWQEGGETSSWRPTAVEWPQRGRGSDEFYSWCFRRLSDFVTKATGYSHVDRLGSRPSALLRPERIQRTICSGLDFFAMLPEAYTYRDLFNKLRLVPSKSAVDVPTYVVEHADELRYLLPGEGNCIREDAPGRHGGVES